MIKSNYSGTRTPKSHHDLGVTSYKGLSFSYNTKTSSFDVEVHITTSYTSLFNGGAMSAMEKQNPGLLKEVTAHEEGHHRQIIEAVKTDISVKILIGGEEKKYKGRIDDVLTLAAKDFSKLKNTALQNKIKNGEIRTEEEANKFIAKGQTAQLRRMIKKITTFCFCISYFLISGHAQSDTTQQKFIEMEYDYRIDRDQIIKSFADSLNM